MEGALPQLDNQSEQAVERLSFFMLKEAYAAIASIFRRTDPESAAILFDVIEKKFETSLQRIYAQQSEGPNTTAIVTAIAETLAPVLDEAHLEPLKLRTTFDPHQIGDGDHTKVSAGAEVAIALASQAKSRAA